MGRPVTVAITCLLTVSLARAAEEAVPLDKLPAKVAAAVKAKFPKAELKSAQKEIDDGKTLYEVAIRDEGRAIEVTVQEDGTIVEIEKEIAAKDLPKAVAEALAAKHPKAEITKAEEILEGDKRSFEVLIITADKKKLEIKFAPDGKVLAEESGDGE